MNFLSWVFFAKSGIPSQFFEKSFRHCDSVNQSDTIRRYQLHSVVLWLLLSFAVVRSMLLMKEKLVVESSNFFHSYWEWGAPRCVVLPESYISDTLKERGRPITALLCVDSAFTSNKHSHEKRPTLKSVLDRDKYFLLLLLFSSSSSFDHFQ